MIRAGLATVAVALAAALATISVRGTDALTRFEIFRVERVHVVGTRYLEPREAVAAAGITTASGIFEDRRRWRAALLEHPLVEWVSIERRFPGRIVLRVTETQPVALARLPELRPVDGRGRVLPIEPAGQTFDLPVLGSAAQADDTTSALDPESAAAVRAYDQVRRHSPAVAARVSEIHPASGGAVRLLLADPAGVEVLVPGDVGPDHVERLGLAIRNLSETGELTAVRRLDVRFRDQVVVSMTSTLAS